jgi:gamma-glutamyltranspeptidase/glutathione hydrolase
MSAALATVPAPAGQEADPERTVTARHGLVVSVSPPASEAGLDVLKKGGNAVDAAVATAFALAVTWPAAGNIGGGGFLLVHPPAGRGEPAVVEYRETAPAAATRDMFKGQKDWHNHRAVGVPGTVRGMALAHQKFGKLPWRDLVLPAVRLAEEGFPVDAPLAASLNEALKEAESFPELRRVYGKDGGKGVWARGDRLVLGDLAKTLRLIADDGPDAFYRGPIADRLVEEMKRGGGLITKADLEAYRAKLRKPVHGTYRGHDVYGPPPPSSGGVCLVQMLNVLENFDLKGQGRWSPPTLHLMAEAMRRAYCDRAKHLGDPDFVTIPGHLTGKDYARKLARGIDLTKATRSEDLAGDVPLAGEGDSTTHFSVIDKDGMAVANTYTLEHSYGARVVVRGAGFLLNNEMGDFNANPGVTTRAGGIGTEANQVAPGKRMLSSQTPTIVTKGGKVVLITGSPGGRTIINTALCVVVNVVDFGMTVREAVDAPRLHHQWFPDRLRFEGVSRFPEAVGRLRQMGHRVTGHRQGDAHSIGVDPQSGLYHGAADRRINGKAAGY